MILIQIIDIILLAAFAGILGYLALLSGAALRGRPQHINNEHKYRFAVVVPAYNEDKMIAKTLYSLFSLVYPKNFYDVFVIADNCSDDTADIARSIGAKVLERHNKEQRGKGYALAWGFERILTDDTSYEAVVVIDSDSLVTGNLLEVMNAYLHEGARVIQSNYLVQPKPKAWNSEMSRIGFLLYNYVRPMGRKVLGLSTGLRGNGMCFSREVLQAHPWKAWSLIEDVEYSLKLNLKGVFVEFAPLACVWTEMPDNPKSAESQRERWELGRFEIIKKYAGPLFKAAWQQKSLKHLDILIDLVTPPLVNMMVIVTVIILTHTFLMVQILGEEWMIYEYGLLWVLTGFLAFFHFIAGLYSANADKLLFKSIHYIPRYIFWKMKIYFKILFKGKEKEWIRTSRDNK